MTQPGYGPFDAHGRPLPPPYTPPPPRKNLLPWLIVGGAVLLSGLGILLVLLLRPDRAGPEAAPLSSRTAISTPSTAPRTHRDLPGGAEVAHEDTGGRARFDGSDQVALSWVQAMADGDFRTVYDLSCADVQRSATDAAAGGDPAEELGTYFFERTLSGRRFTAASFDSIIYNSDADSDIASFTLQLDNGEEFLLLVYVQGDGTVCDFI